MEMFLFLMNGKLINLQPAFEIPPPPLVRVGHTVGGSGVSIFQKSFKLCLKLETGSALPSCMIMTKGKTLWNLTGQRKRKL